MKGLTFKNNSLTLLQRRKEFQNMTDKCQVDKPQLFRLLHITKSMKSVSDEILEGFNIDLVFNSIRDFDFETLSLILNNGKFKVFNIKICESEIKYRYLYSSDMANKLETINFYEVFKNLKIKGIIIFTIEILYKYAIIAFEKINPEIFYHNTFIRKKDTTSIISSLRRHN